ncbi:hypothetical protein VKT23_014669 [Stygiomarasmius scandens]|uniref:Uncharacterized protein n=1 Tax=Marasmiellus scandens TaxID=2682957 RepID=A0ABR1J4L4_9AGAR
MVYESKTTEYTLDEKEDGWLDVTANHNGPKVEKQEDDDELARERNPYKQDDFLFLARRRINELEETVERLRYENTGVKELEVTVKKLKDEIKNLKDKLKRKDKEKCKCAKKKMNGRD